MTEKRALVTGAGKRLGQAMAIYLAERGYDVAVHYASSDDGARATADQIAGRNRKAALLQADLLAEDQTQALVGRAADALGGPLSVLVNNASIFEYDTIRTATRESWDRHIESNLRAPYVLTQHFAAQALKAAERADGELEAEALVVNMIDQRVRKLTPEFSSYTIAKMGLWALTRTAAQGLAPDIRVNAIGPGPTLPGPRESREHFETHRRTTILGRGSDVPDVTAALGYLLDARAVSGQLICVDGGQHLGWKTPDILGIQ